MTAVAPPGAPVVAAYVTVEIRLALPVTDLYRSYVHRHPGHAAVDTTTPAHAHAHAHARTTTSATAISLSQPSSGEEGDEAQRLFNYLDVTVAKVTGLPGSAAGMGAGAGTGAPLAYVHFQLMGHPGSSYLGPI